MARETVVEFILLGLLALIFIGIGTGAINFVYTMFGMLQNIL